MRRLFLILALAACQMQEPTEAPLAPVPDVAGLQDEAIEVAPLTSAASDAVADQPAVLPDLPAPPSDMPRPLPRPASPAAANPAPAPAVEAPPAPLVSPQEAACTRSGGQWATVGESGRICLHQTRQGGKSCRKKSDCKGECLAQSGTCSPIAPLMGCNAVLDDQGREMTQCLQ